MPKNIFISFQLVTLLLSTAYASEPTITRDKYAQTKELVESINKSIQAKSPYNRPANCPLKPVNFKELLAKIVTVKNSFQAECKSKNQAVIDQVNVSTDKLNGLLSTVNQDGANESALYNNQNLSAALSGISSLASKEECFYNIKENGVLLTLSDVILSVSQLGLIVPSANGLVLAAGGSLFSSVLTVIDQVLKNKLDWDNEEERNAFTTFNCSFYEIREDLSNSGLLSIPTQKLKERLEKYNKQNETVAHQIDLLNSEREDLESILATSLKEALELNYGNSNQSVLDIAVKWNDLLNKEDGATELSKRRVLGDMVLTSKDFIAELTLANLSDQNNIFKADMLSLFEVLVRDQSNIGELMAINIGEFQTLKQEFQYYIERLIIDLTTQKETVIKNWSAEASSFDGFTNGEAQAQIDEKYSELLADAENLKNYYSNLVKVSKNLLGVKDFSDQDEGSSVKLDILLNYQDIKDLIYGKVGWSYMKYLLSEGTISRRYFNKSSRQFDVKSKDRVQACRNAIKLSEEWVKTKTYAEEANNFIFTNYGLFHDYTKKFKHFLFIPVGKSNERALREQVSSLKALEKYNTLGSDSLNKKEKKLLKRRSLGRLILKITDDTRKSEIIQDYVKENSCENMI